MAYLLDADVCIYAMSEQHPRLVQRMERAGTGVCTSSIVLGELWFGAEKSERKTANYKQLRDLLDRLPVVAFDAEAARHYGEIRDHLERAGTPIGSNDTLIAAHARSLNLTLVTNNRRAFDRVPGLKVETWL